MNLLQELHRNGIEPMVTLYHWDLPTALQNQGGWMNNKVVGWFTDYARLCFQHFGPLVKHWATINEPKQICHAGYGIGIGAPGITSGGVGEYLCAKYVLLAHASAYHVYDKEFRPTQQGKITIVLDSDWYEPGTPADEAAAEVRRQFVVSWFLDLTFISYLRIVLSITIDYKCLRYLLDNPEFHLPLKTGYDITRDNHKR
nr:unnamed protein product [Callosobruchus chinensis]